MLRLVLNSGSPRRRELIALLPWPCALAALPVDERVAPGLSPEEMVRSLATQKARAAAPAYPGCTIIGADTLVFVNGRPLGKPADREDGARMLRLLSGKRHEVLTGLCLWNADTGACTAAAERTGVWVDELTEGEIQAYLDTGDPFDKAGAYGIQGPFARHIRGVEGCYFNVVGLPVNRLYRLIREIDHP